MTVVEEFDNPTQGWEGHHKNEFFEREFYVRSN